MWGEEGQGGAFDEKLSEELMMRGSARGALEEKI